MDEYCSDGALGLGAVFHDEETWVVDVVVALGKDEVVDQEVAEEEDKLDNVACAGVVALLDVETSERNGLEGQNDEDNIRSGLCSPGRESQAACKEDGGNEAGVLDGHSEVDQRDNHEDS